MKTIFTNDEVVQSIKLGGKNMEAALRYLYDTSEFKNEVQNWLKKQGIKEQDVEDIFQDGVRHLIINIRKDTFRGDSSLKTYLSKICFNIWRTQHRRVQKLDNIKQNLETNNKDQESPEAIFIQQEKGDLLRGLLDRMGKSCKKVLALWSLNYSMKEIASELNYKSEGMARTKKYKCFKKLTAYLKDKPELINELLMED